MKFLRREFIKSLPGFGGAGFLLPEWLMTLLRQEDAILSPDGDVASRKIIVPIEGNHLGQDRMEKLVLKWRIWRGQPAKQYLYHMTATRQWLHHYVRVLEKKKLAIVTKNNQWDIAGHFVGTEEEKVRRAIKDGWEYKGETCGF